jgi:hypothetical protein
MKRRGIALATALLVLPLPAAAADDADLSLSSIVTRGAERRVGPDDLAEGLGGVLRAATGADHFPISCATPVILLLARPDHPLPASLLPASAAVTERPRLEDERVAVARDGQSVIHYSASARTSGLMSVDRDRNGQPDLIDRLAEALAASRSFLTGRLGYPSPAPDGTRLDVFVDHLGRGLDGAAISGLETAPGAPATSGFIVLDDELPAERVMSATLHQVAHLSLAALSARTSPWWAEASASFLTVSGTGDLSSHEAGLRARLQSPGRSLSSDSMLLMQGSLLWPLFLAERAGGPGIVRQIWAELAQQGHDPLTATDQVLRRSAGISLVEATREYAAWNLFTGERDIARHYSIARALPRSQLPTIEPGPPFQIGPVEPVEALGSIAFRLPGNGNRGALDLELTVQGGNPAADVLVFYEDDGPLPVLVGVALKADGTGRVSIPWGQAREAWIIMRNQATASGESSSFQVRGALDPYAPYDLASFNARASGPSIILEWTTASEKGLVGWIVYRSPTPGGPFSRLNAVAIPAFGDSTAETGYIFIDDSARRENRYYYRIEGFTDLGLAERSHVVSGRVSATR